MLFLATCRNSISKVYPAMYIENITELAFDDITPEDPDFPSIQGLAFRCLDYTERQCDSRCFLIEFYLHHQVWLNQDLSQVSSQDVIWILPWMRTRVHTTFLLQGDVIISCCRHSLYSAIIYIFLFILFYRNIIH